jgi:hypothetical protein
VGEALPDAEGLAVKVEHRQIANVIINSDTRSLKSIAWAFGCSKKGSDVERELLAVLVARVQEGRLPA